MKKFYEAMRQVGRWVKSWFQERYVLGAVVGEADLRDYVQRLLEGKSPLPLQLYLFLEEPTSMRGSTFRCQQVLKALGLQVVPVPPLPKLECDDTTSPEERIPLSAIQ